MSPLERYGVNVCPVNLLRPTILPSVPTSSHNAIVDVYNHALAQKDQGFYATLMEAYSLNVNTTPKVLDYTSLLAFYDKYSGIIKHTLLSLWYMNAHGCVLRTTNTLYRSLQDSLHGIDGGWESTRTALLFTLVLSLTGIISCYRASDSSAMQCIYSMCILLIYNTVFVLIQDGFNALIVSIVHLSTLILITRRKQTPSDFVGFGSLVVRFRGLFMLATIIAILAYDNLHFNRHCSKTFFNGFSAMDIGCGFMIVHSGSMRALSKNNIPRDITKILRRNFPLILLGILRLVSTRAVNYNVPVEEYGVHWNFFLALAVAKILSEIILSIVPPNFVPLVPLMIGTFYEIALWYFDVATVLPMIKRVGIFSANKEGIVAIPNSVTLFLFGYSVTQSCKLIYEKRGQAYTLLRLSVTWLCCGLGSYMLYLIGLPSSRTLGNARFVLNTGCVFTWGLFTVLLAEIIFGNRIDSTVLDCIGRHSFVFFLLANFITGT
uniref:GPI-anchored wall transfer protein 1 n=1 Tax=Babesia bovis TaxID=5865 RepID=S6C8R8_BABBO|nr:conserved hypothetical protein [Babesia bovis]